MNSPVLPESNESSKEVRILMTSSAGKNFWAAFSCSNDLIIVGALLPYKAGKLVPSCFICFSTEPVAIIDNESLTYLRGSVIDLDDSGLNKQLKVNNPGAKMSCGCGTSFAYDDAYWEQMMAQEG